MQQVVNFHRRVPATADAPAGVVTQLALVARESGDGSLTLIALDPDKLDHLGSPDFHLALIRKVGVLPAEHQDVTDGKVAEFYSTTQPTSDAEVERLAAFLLANYPKSIKEGSAVDAAIAVMEAWPHEADRDASKLTDFLLEKFPSEIKPGVNVVDVAIKILSAIELLDAIHGEGSDAPPPTEALPADPQDVIVPDAPTV